MAFSSVGYVGIEGNGRLLDAKQFKHGDLSLDIFSERRAQPPSEATPSASAQVTATTSDSTDADAKPVNFVDLDEDTLLEVLGFVAADPLWVSEAM